MTRRNTILKKYNGTSYDNVYPTTKASDVKCTNPFTGEASNLQDTIDYMKMMTDPSFYLTNGDQERYNYSAGMTWGEWVSSEYNTTDQGSSTYGRKIGVRSDGYIGYYFHPEMGVDTDILIKYNNVNVTPTDTIILKGVYQVVLAPV